MNSSAQSSNRRRSRSALLAALLLSSCLVVAGAVILSRRGSARSVLVQNADGSSIRLDVSVLGGKRLLDAATGAEKTFAFGPANTLVVLMSAGDCPNCLRERSVWAELSRGHDASELQVVGVLLRTSPQEARTFAKTYELPFPVYLDYENRLGRATELPRLTPFKVLVNSKGEALLADGPNPTASTQAAFGERVNKRLSPAEVTR